MDTRATPLAQRLVEACYISSVVRRITLAHAGRPGRAHGGLGPRFAAAVLFGSLLPGCPLSDAYFVDPNATLGTAGTGADHSGTGGMAGGLASGGKGGRQAGGTGGRGGPGGKGDAGAPAAAGKAGGTAAGGMAGTAGSSPGCEPMERCDGLDNDCNQQIDEGSVCPASCSAQQYDGHAYLLCVSGAASDSINADDAEARCGDLGRASGLVLELAWIESSGENDFLKRWIMETAPADGVVWMGANDQTTEGTWVWGRRDGAEQFFTGSDSGGGSAYMDRFNDFGEGQPGSSRGRDEDCGAFDARVDWRWSDRECSEAMVGFVCEEHAP